jgi:hypothetical protein
MSKSPAHNVADVPEYYRLPSGKYVAKVKYVEKETLDNGHQQVRLTWKIIHGRYKGTLFPWYIDLDDHSPLDLKELDCSSKMSGDAVGLTGQALLDIRVTHMPCPDCGGRMKCFRIRIINVNQSANK